MRWVELVFAFLLVVSLAGGQGLGAGAGRLTPAEAEKMKRAIDASLAQAMRELRTRLHDLVDQAAAAPDGASFDALLAEFEGASRSPQSPSLRIDDLWVALGVQVVEPSAEFRWLHSLRPRQGARVLGGTAGSILLERGVRPGDVLVASENVPLAATGAVFGDPAPSKLQSGQLMVIRGGTLEREVISIGSVLGSALRLGCLPPAAVDGFSLDGDPAVVIQDVMSKVIRELTPTGPVVIPRADSEESKRQLQGENKKPLPEKLKVP